MKDFIHLVVGLGNPGKRYTETRHNAGFWFVDRVASARGVQWRSETRFFGDLAELASPGGKLRLLKPTTFMNESGRAVGAVARYFDLAPEQILVAHDEIDLPPGTVRLKRGGGHGGHNGLRDVIPQLGSTSFARLRIGVGHPGTKEQVIDYVLSRAGKEERSTIEHVLERVVADFDLLAAGKLEKVMNELHRKPPVDGAGPEASTGRNG